MAIAFWTFILTLWIIGIVGGGFAGYAGMCETDSAYNRRKDDDDKTWQKWLALGIGGWLVCIVTSSSFIVTVCRAIYFAMNSGAPQ